MTMLRALRSDGLPESHEYRDTGCSVSPTCLACPLVVCRYDKHAIEVRSDERAIEVRTLTAQGLSAVAIASRLQISRRTVFRLRQER